MRTIDRMEKALSGGTPDMKIVKEFLKAQREMVQTNKALEMSLGNLNKQEKEHLATQEESIRRQKEATSTFKAQATVMNTSANAYARLKAQQKLAADQALRMSATLEMQKRAGVTDE